MEKTRKEKFKQKWEDLKDAVELWWMEMLPVRWFVAIVSILAVVIIACFAAVVAILQAYGIPIK